MRLNNKSAVLVAMVLIMSHVDAGSITDRTAAKANLLLNGSFETVNPFRKFSDDCELAKPFPYWNCVGGWPDCIHVSRLACDGNLSAQITGGWLKQGVRVSGGKRYIISGFMKTSTTALPEDVEPVSYFEIRDITGT